MGLLLFFDGACGFCSASVRAVHRLDGKGRIDFAPLGGKSAEERGFSDFGKAGEGSLVLFNEETGEVFTKSSAVAMLADVLGGCGFLIRIFPKVMTDAVYDLIARNRAGLPGAGICEIPDEDFRLRMRD